MMASDQIIELLKRGALEKGEDGKAMQASTYRFIWKRDSDDRDQPTLPASGFRRSPSGANHEMISENL
jgi:hypothetical protein